MGSFALTLGTRGSALARWQARHVTERLAGMHPGLAVTERVIRTEGDDAAGPVPGAVEPGRGIFVRRIEEALLAGEIDAAVHSLKDMPTELPAGLTIAAVLERHDARDALVTRDGASLERLRSGAVVGTGSFRRRCQLLHRRPDLRVEPMRGNVDTRLRTMSEGRVEALVLALAAIERLGLREPPCHPLPPEVCLPAAGQGALAVECRIDDERVAAIVGALDHAASRARVEAERSFLHRLGGGCLAPATAYATIRAGRLSVEALVGDPDGRVLICDREVGEVAEAQRIGARLAERLLVAGADGILERCRAGDDAGG